MYQDELYESYGVFVDVEEAKLHLQALTHSMFPTVIAGDCSESRDDLQVNAERTCGESHSDTMPADGGNEVGASITPTSGQPKFIHD